jgi:hypothetical protein
MVLHKQFYLRTGLKERGYESRFTFLIVCVYDSRILPAQSFGQMRAMPGVFGCDIAHSEGNDS